MKAKEWGVQGTDQIPESYLMQVAFYSAICNVDKVDIAVLIGGQEFRTYTYFKNEEFEHKLIQAACAFWNNYVAKRVAPEASCIKDITNMFPNSNGSTIEADESIVQEVSTLKDIKVQEKLLATQKADIELKIKSCIGEHEALINADGDLLATWKSGKARQVLDSKKLQAEHKGIYQEYLTEKVGSRSFLLK
jgi:predicted phage-related endonuclease